MDNGIDRVQPGEVAFGDDAVADTEALLAIRIVLGVACDLFPKRRDLLSGLAPEPEKGAKQALASIGSLDFEPEF